MLLVNEGDFVKEGTRLVEWDPSSIILIAEKSGTVEYSDIIHNVTVHNKYDNVTDRVTLCVNDQKNDKYQPSLNILQNDTLVDTYILPVNAIINVENGQKVFAGDIIAKIALDTSKIKDITGGLPKIAMLFEARMVKDPCIIAEISGSVSIGGIHKNMRKVSLVSNEKTVTYLIPRSKMLIVSNGEKVNVGDALTSGAPSLQDLLKIKGIDYIQYYLINQIQLVYRSNGVLINDRHFEIIVRQMTRKVRIIDPGDSSFLIGDKVSWAQIDIINQSLRKEDKKIIVYIPELIGITLASLGTESFIAAASFQETTRILADAAVSGQIDCLHGPKENVIIGRLIPAGTGFDQSGR
jgi:DNA-directed RNA polymerase subunit beta'